jgi:hypothetical protein
MAAVTAAPTGSVGQLNVVVDALQLTLGDAENPRVAVHPETLTTTLLAGSGPLLVTTAVNAKWQDGQVGPKQPKGSVFFWNVGAMVVTRSAVALGLEVADAGRETSKDTASSTATAPVTA